jgi:hypothetical protein
MTKQDQINKILSKILWLEKRRARTSNPWAVKALTSDIISLNCQLKQLEKAA